MPALVSNLSHRIYVRIIKPLLFKQQPDVVHQKLLRISGFVQRHASLRWLIRKAWSYENLGYLEQRILSSHYPNPIGLSAGFDKNFELPLLLHAVGFGFMEGGSITNNQCDGNPRPWFYRLPKTRSLVVYAGLANDGAEIILNRIAHLPKRALHNFPINISVAKTNSQAAASERDAIEDYIQSLTRIKKMNLGDVITINISCPNTYGGEPFTTPSRLERLLQRVDEVQLSQPLFIKMPIDLVWPQFEGLLKVAEKHTIAGVTIGNLAKDRTTVTLLDPLPKTIKGGLSGRPTWDLSNELIRQTFRKYHERFIIIGVGGVFSAEDAYTKIRLGASLVELITGMIFEGPQLIGTINRGLVHLLKRDGYTNISEVIGIDARA